MKIYASLMEIVLDNPDKPWNWCQLSGNPSITFQDVVDNPDKPWYWRRLSLNRSITFQNVLDNPDKPWVWGSLSKTKFDETLYRQNKSARIIQKGCYNWLYHATTRDDLIGIGCRIGMKQCGLLSKDQIKF